MRQVLQSAMIITNYDSAVMALSIKCDLRTDSWPYELSHVKNEFSLVGLTACQYENG